MQNTSGLDSAPGAHVVRALDRFRRKIRRTLIFERVLVIAAAAIAAVFLGAALDSIFRAPSAVRTIGLIGAIAIGVYAVMRWLVPVARFRPALTDLALRLPGSETDDEALAATVRYAQAGSENNTKQSDGLALQIERHITQAASHDARLKSTSTIVRNDRAVRAGIVCAIALGAAGVVGMVQPTIASIGVQRILLPWTNVSWPKRTLIADATSTTVHPATRALVLRADMLKTHRQLGQTRVLARYQIFKGKRVVGSTQQVVLSAQPAGKATSGNDRYEQVIDRETWSSRTTDDGDAWSVRYWFETIDDRTPTVRVRLADPPTVLAATSTVTLPSYYPKNSETEQPSAIAPAFAMGTQPIVLGAAGTRAPLEPIHVLERSAVVLALDMNKPIERVDWVNKDTGQETQVDNEAHSPSQLVITHEDQRVTVTGTLDRSVPISLRFVDKDGLVSEHDTVVLIETVADELPSPALLEPAQDEWVLPTASFAVVGEVVDDVALHQGSLAWELARAVQGSAGAPPEPEGNRTEIAMRSVVVDSIEPASVQIRLSSDLSIEETGAQPGDEVRLVTMGTDLRMASMSPPIEPIVSRSRRLRVVSEEQFVDRIWQSLDMVRDAAKVIDQHQAAMIDDAASSDRPTTQQEQQSITDRTNAQQQAVQDAIASAQRNGLDRPDVSRVLDEALRATEDATQASSDAADAWENDQQNEGSENESNETTDGPSKKSSAHQQEVRDALGELLRALDRGSDSFLARRSVARLLEQQIQLNEQTADLADRTVGKRENQLTAAQRAEQAALEQAQGELAQRANEVLDELADQEENLREKDLVGAEVVKNAEQTGRENNLSQQMQQAASSLQDSKNQQAQREQQEAIETLEQMMDQLEQAEQTRDRVLERVFADLKQQIELLVQMQETELATLGARVSQHPDAPVIDGLDAGMISLHRATGPVLDLADAAMPESQPVLDALKSAEAAMLDAIGMLRASNAPGARDAETESLEQLMLAKEDAERLRAASANRERQRQQKALREAYTEIRQMQVVVRDDTLPFVGKDMNRKERVLVRRLSASQREVGQRLRELPEMFEGLFEATTLAFAHRRLDALIERASDTMKRGLADATVVRDQESVLRLLDLLAEAMDNASKKSDEFSDSSSSQQGSGGGPSGGNQPLFEALAELELLRAMQADVHDLTRLADEGNVDASEVEQLGLLQQELAEETSTLLRRLTQQGPGQAAPSEDDAPEPNVPPGMGFGAVFQPELPEGAQPEIPEDPVGDQPEVPENDDNLRSLDDLLGLDESPADDFDTRELFDLLEGAQDTDPLANAAKLMSRAADRLAENTNPGITTQRIQEQILLQLEKVIQQARDAQQQQQQSSSSQQQQQQQDQKQPSQQQQDASKNPKGDNTGQQQLVPGQDAQPGQAAAGAQASWGSLPARVRDTLTQGSSDTFSSMYRTMTEAYYKRLAEEGSK